MEVEWGKTNQREFVKIEEEEFERLNGKGQ